MLFISVLIVGVFAFIGITFINSVDNARVLSATTEWRNEAIMIANRFISDPDCVGYVKTLIKYTNETGNDGLISTRLSVPMTVDANKLFDNNLINIKRLDDCIRMQSPEYNLFFSVKVVADGVTYPVVSNLDPNKYKNQATLQEISLPVRIISDNGFNYGVITFSISVSAEYFAAKLL